MTSASVSTIAHSQRCDARDAMGAEGPQSSLELSFPHAQRVAFRDFNNKYLGRKCYIIGRGPTQFDYSSLADVSEPIFFINDAVCLEKYARSETFFFAHDVQLRPWLDGSLRSTAVLPINGTILGDPPGDILNHTGPVVFYRRRERNKKALLRKSRNHVAEAEELFSHTGTIHSLLHFVWFCGFSRAVLIGCDGLVANQPETQPDGLDAGYDARLENRSHSKSGQNYQTIRWAQDLLMTLLGIRAIYLGRPAFSTFVSPSVNNA